MRRGKCWDRSNTETNSETNFVLALELLGYYACGISLLVVDQMYAPPIDLFPYCAFLMSYRRADL